MHPTTERQRITVIALIVIQVNTLPLRIAHGVRLDVSEVRCACTLAASIKAQDPVHALLSNFKSHIQGTYHGITQDRLQSYADEFCWRYNHRGMKAKFELLVTDLCQHVKRERRKIPLLFLPQVVLTNKAA